MTGASSPAGENSVRHFFASRPNSALEMSPIARVLAVAACACFSQMAASDVAGAQTASDGPQLAPYGVVLTPISSARPRPPSAFIASDTGASVVASDDGSDARQRHKRIGSLIGGAVGLGVGIQMARCDPTGDRGVACAGLGIMRVALFTSLGIAAGAIAGYLWPTAN